MTRDDPTRAHAEQVDRVWEHLVAGRRTVLVQSPPGAGKSTLSREVARRWHERSGHSVPIVTQTNNQADDLAIALAEEGARVGRLHGSQYEPPATVRAAGAVCATDVGLLAGNDVIVAPAAKWAFVKPPHRWELAIIDEAFQMRSDLLMKVADRFERLLLVGDPGQLQPFTTTDDHFLRGVPLSPLDTAAGTILVSCPDTPVVNLPVSWRLPPSAARVVSASFYAMPFQAGVEKGVRSLQPRTTRAHNSIDQAVVDAAARGWAFLALDDLFMPQVDPEAVEAIAGVVDRVLGVGVTATHERGSHVLEARHIAVGVAHRDQRAQVRTAVDAVLARRGLTPGSVSVDTANRLQGRQFDLVVAWHPLSGRRDASAFHLESGRLCVLLSRHRHACIVVGRDGIREQLEAYPGGDPIWIGEKTPTVDGWEANLSLLEHLEEHRISA